MTPSRFILRGSFRRAVRWLGALALLALFAYVCYVAAAWLAYGHHDFPAGAKIDSAHLDVLMPDFDVSGRHSVRVAAPAEITFRAASQMNPEQSAAIRTLFNARALILTGKPMASSEEARRQGLIERATSWGWTVLAEDPGHELIFGAVTQPWAPKPVFRGLPADQFKSFREPGYVKIAWTLRVDPIDAKTCIARTETRVATTDSVSRTKFRRYWAFFSPGIFATRWFALHLVRADAQRDAKRSLPLASRLDLRSPALLP